MRKRPLAIDGVLIPGGTIELEVNEFTVRVTHMIDGDGNHFVELSGVDCSLEGEMPGLYYPVKSGS